VRDVRLALLGFGHVGQAFARLLLLKTWLLRERHGLNPVVTAVITGRHGWIVDEAGIQLSAVLGVPGLASTGPPPAIATLPADVLIELTPVNPRDGQPALGWLHEGLLADMDVITANKGPIAHGFRALSELAAQRGRRLRSEAQRRGIAERDPSNDLDGWDAALKATILANVLMGMDLKVDEVARQPLTAETAARAYDAAQRSHRLRMLAAIGPFGTRWAPVEVGPDDPFFAVDGFSMALELDTDVAGRLALALQDPGVEQTAFAVLADLVDVAGTV